MPFSLAAEIQRRLLPSSFTLEADTFTLAGWLEPTSEIAGDTFDYSLERDALYLSLSDAMGHSVNAAQLAVLAVGSMRNSRRSHEGIVAQARAASEAVARHGKGGEGFVTALLGRLDLSTGDLDLVNAGHPSPYICHDGQVRALGLTGEFPLGMFPDVVYREQDTRLAAGDRLLMVTDGMLERGASSLDIATALDAMRELHPRELVHRLASAVVEETGGELQDDATLLCLDWHGPRRRR